MKKALISAILLGMATTAGAAQNQVEQFDLNFTTTIDANFAFERNDGKSWNDPLQFTYNPVASRFDEVKVMTSVKLAGAALTNPLKAKIVPGAKVVHNMDVSKTLPITVSLDGKTLNGTHQELTASGAANQTMPMVVNLTTSGQPEIGNYSGSFSIIFEREV